MAVSNRLVPESEVKKENRMKLISSRIRECIEEKKISEGREISQKEIAEKIVFINPVAFNQYANGKRIPPVDVIEKLSAYFHVRPQWLFGIDGFKTEEEVNQYCSWLGEDDFGQLKPQPSEIETSKIVSNSLHSYISKLEKSGKFLEIKDSKAFTDLFESSVDSFLEFYMNHLNNLLISDSDAHGKK